MPAEIYRERLDREPGLLRQAVAVLPLAPCQSVGMKRRKETDRAMHEHAEREGLGFGLSRRSGMLHDVRQLFYVSTPGLSFKAITRGQNQRVQAGKPRAVRAFDS